jgi:hypothetical protein
MVTKYLIINKDKIQYDNIKILHKHNKLKINYNINNIIVLGIPINIKDFQYIDNYSYILIKLNDKNDINLFKTINESLKKKVNNDIIPIISEKNIIKIKYYGDKENIKKLDNLNISINNIYFKNNCYFTNIFLLD